MPRISRYGSLRFLYPVHYRSFCHVQGRSTVWGMSSDFTDDASGFLLFIEEIGPIPADMIKPTVGRKDHSKGYVYGNFAWQSNSDNAREATTRVMANLDYRRRLSESFKGRVLSDEWKRKISESLKGRLIGLRSALSDDHRRKISDALKGRVCSAETRKKMSVALLGNHNACRS